MKRNVMVSGEFTLSEMTSTSTNAATTAPKKKTGKALIEALKAAGVDTSNYFVMGEDMVVKVVDGIPTQVTEDDPVLASIKSGGYINHYKLFRRWVMAQMFHMLRRMEEDRNANMTQLIQNMGYEYSWRVVENELYAQYKMEKHGDKENLGKRRLWFNKTNIAVMMDEYIESLRDYIQKNLLFKKELDTNGERVFKHRCKGVPYIRFAGKNIFAEDISSKIIYPLESMCYSIKDATSVKEEYNIIRKFNKERKHLLAKTTMSKTFINAYKGSGAYFTMRNLIMFHGAKFKGMSKEKSLHHVDTEAIALAENEDWQMVGLMKRLISDSGISIQGKIDEWLPKAK